MLADISYGRNMLGFKGIHEIREVNKITILVRKLKGERFENLQHNEVAQLLKAHSEEVSEEETEHLVAADKGEEQETDNQIKAREQRLPVFPVSRQRNWPT